MTQTSGSVSSFSGAKKGIVLAIVAVGIIFLALYLLPKNLTKGSKIVTQGDSAPDFTLSSLDGRQVSLSALRGKVVMVHFWATWCPPCVEEMPTLEKLFRTMAGKDFEILAISVDEGGADDVSAFMQRNRLTLPVLIDSKQSVSRKYGTFKFPETYLVDRNGLVAYKVIGPRNWDEPAAVKALQGLL